MKKLLIVCLVCFVAMTFGFTNAFTQTPSSKGSAAIGKFTVLETHSFDPVMSTIIQVAQQKELVFDVALQCGLYTDTLVRSKGGNKDTSTAEVAIDVRVKLQKLNNAGEPIGEPFLAHPGVVTYAKRSQTLMAKFQGIFQQCEEWVEVEDPYTGETRPECQKYSENTCLNVTGEDTNGDDIDDNYVTTVDVDCLDYEEVQLIQETINANAFNFIRSNLVQGEYLVTVEAQITPDTYMENGGAEAKGMIGMGSMVVDEARFIKGDEGTGL